MLRTCFHEVGCWEAAFTKSDAVQTCYSQAATERSEQREVAPEKQCRRCRETKGANDFYHSKMTADGLQSYCKACYASAAANRRRQSASNRSDHDSDLPGDLSPEQLQHMQVKRALRNKFAIRTSLGRMAFISCKRLWLLDSPMCLLPLEIMPTSYELISHA